MGVATPYADKVSESWILGLSNEVYNISEFWVLFEKIAQNRRNLTQKIATGPILFCGSVHECKLKFVAVSFREMNE